MEETIGAWWDKIVTKVAYSGFPDARVELSEIAPLASIVYRALGGDAGLQLQTSTAQRHGASLSWLQRIAGIGERCELAWSSDQHLYLPSFVDCYPTRELNRELYLWLLLLLAHDVAPQASWIQRNQAATCAVLNAFPGMRQRYLRLVQNHLPLRRQYQANMRTSSNVAKNEAMIAQALLEPGSLNEELADGTSIYPVVCWMRPDIGDANNSLVKPRARPAQQENQAKDKRHTDQEAKTKKKKHSAQYTDMPQPKSPFMLLFRAESLFSWAEYVKVNRDLDEDDNPDAEKAAEDLDFMSVANDGKSLANRLRFDLDLPSEADDDIILTEGLRYPEWNYKKQAYLNDHTHVEMMLARDAQEQALPLHLQAMAQALRQQFQCLRPQRQRLRSQIEGDEIDIDACVRYFSEHQRQQQTAQQGHRASTWRSSESPIYTAVRPQQRDLSCLLLADLSMSTDAAINNQQRVIDVIRDSLYLFSEALHASGDKFALYGFSSVRRHHVRMHLLKGFDERYQAQIRGRLAEIKPGFYTRMGAAIRHASALLQKQTSQRRLLLILTDGKPNDLDHYEGRYGIEDTRLAIQEARDLGLIPFCVTIDEEAHDYLPHLFGHKSFTVVRQAADLPLILPRLYAQLTAA